MSDPRRADPRRRSNYAEQGGYRQAQRPVKEESGPQIHDEADLVSFRSDALKRMLTNHELLENATTKYVHTSRIMAPGIWATGGRGSAGMSSEERRKYLAEQPNKPYFGDLQLMEAKSEALREEINELQAARIEDMVDPEYTFQQEATNLLAQKLAEVTDEESFQAYQKELEAVTTKMQQDHSKVYRADVPYTKRSISPLAFGIKLEQAPANYNPKLVNTMIGGLANEYMDTDYRGSDNIQPPDANKQPQYSMDMLQGGGAGSGEAGDSVMDDNMESMFGPELLDNDMNELINFDQADDDGPMDNAGFEGDFLKLE